MGEKETNFKKQQNKLNVRMWMVLLTCVWVMYVRKKRMAKSNLDHQLLIFVKLLFKCVWYFLTLSNFNTVWRIMDFLCKYFYVYVLSFATVDHCVQKTLLTCEHYHCWYCAWSGNLNHNLVPLWCMIYLFWFNLMTVLMIISVT